ncbi:MAG: tyrosine-type recombinase/integrase [Thermacetogeniaceae bacterium]
MVKKKARRPNRTGTIFQRKDGRWQGSVYLGSDPKTGKERKKIFYGKSEEEVTEKLRKFIAMRELGLCAEESNVTLEQWLDLWLTQYAKPRVRPTTYDNYEMIVRVHIKPQLGNIKLAKLQPRQIQIFYNYLLEKGRADGKGGLSPRTVTIAHVILHEALEQALKEGLVTRNVAELCSPPKQIKKEARYLTLEEEKRFLSVLKDEPLRAAFILLLGTGLRRGELLGLRWQDVHIEENGEGYIEVRQQLVKAKVNEKNTVIFEPPKTQKGKRIIPLPKWAVEALEVHRKKQEEHKAKCGKRYKDAGLVFATSEGKPILPRNFHRSFKRLIEKAGLQNATIHSLRHTFASRLLELNEHPKVVQELLGHSQISVTLDTYSHVLPEVKKKAIAKLESHIKTE